MPRQILLGMGTGGCGLELLTEIWRQQPHCRATFQQPPLLPWVSRNSQREIQERFTRWQQTTTERFVADVAAFYLPYADTALANTPNLTCVCLRRPEDEVVATMTAALMRHAADYYVKDGKPTDEVHCFKSATKSLVTLFGMVPAKDFGPLQLQAVRNQYVGAGWTRRFCNASVNRLRRIWKWGVSQALVPVATWQALTTVSPLKAGKCAAPDRPKRQAVPDAHLEAVRAKLSPRCQAFFDLLRWTGARPSEIRSLTWAMINQTGPVWTARLMDHKTVSKGKERTIYFGPRAQAVLTRPKRKGSSKVITIGPDTLSEAMRDACEAVKVTPFTPYHLRHTLGTAVRDTIGIEAAQAALGHASADMTAVCTSKMDKLASEAAAKLG